MISKIKDQLYRRSTWHKIILIKDQKIEDKLDKRSTVKNETN